MPDSAVIPATTTFRMTSLAWAVAVQTRHGNAGTAAAGPVTRTGSAPGPGRSTAASWRGWTDATRAAIDGELTTAGITDDAGTIRPQWLQALQTECSCSDPGGPGVTLGTASRRIAG